MEKEKYLKNIKRIVIKIGSALITDGKRIFTDFLENLAYQIYKLQSQKKEIIIVSSGAVACGIYKLKLDHTPYNIFEKQALSAIGQPYLMSIYQKFFEKYSIICSQVLITYQDIANPKSFYLASKTIDYLLKFKTLPIVNENDTVSIEELNIGDNDNLSAHIAVLSNADLLVILTSASGVYDKDPNTYKDAKLIREIKDISKELENINCQTKTKLGTGGMKVKLEAALKAAYKGIPTLIVSGKEKDSILKALKGDIGTFVYPKKKLSKKLYHMLYLHPPKGKVFIDLGAKDAILKGKSLLPKGIKSFFGNFEKGDVIEIFDETNHYLGKGIAKYSSEDLKNILKNLPGKTKCFIHRNEMIIL